MSEYEYSHDDLVLLVGYMHQQGYTAEDIVYAVEKPWKFAEVLKKALEAASSQDTP